LDLLFKPKFGALLQHFKLEIGGDIWSTGDRAFLKENYLEVAV
jgi:hypothetical protein